MNFLHNIFGLIVFFNVAVFIVIFTLAIIDGIQGINGFNDTKVEQLFILNAILFCIFTILLIINNAYLG